MPSMIFLLLFLQCIWCFSPLFFDNIKLNFIVRWVLHSPDVLRCSIVSGRCGLIFWRYCSINNFFLPWHLWSIYLLPKALTSIFSSVVFEESFVILYMKLLADFFKGLARLFNQSYHSYRELPANGFLFFCFFQIHLF